MMKICAGNGLATKTHRYVILILVICMKYGECLRCLVNGYPEWYNPDNQLCCKGLYPRVQNGFEMKCCNGTVYPGHSHQCCNGNVYNQSKTHFCCGDVMHDNKNQNLVCCGGKVYFHGKGICCADKFAPTGDIPLICVNGTAVQKSSSIDNVEIPNVKTTTNVPSEVFYCGQVPYPKESSTYRYECCETVLHKTRHKHTEAYTMMCCGSEIYNTSKDVCCNGSLHMYDVQPIGCCNNKEIYFTTIQTCCGDKVVDKRMYLCANQTSSRKSLVLKDNVNDDKVCFNKQQRTLRTFNSKTHKCDDNSIIANIVEEIKNDTLQTPNVKPQPRVRPIKCHSCITGDHSGPSECTMRNTLSFRLEGIEQRKRDRVWLHITVTYPTKYAGRRMKLMTQRVCQTCFKNGLEYVIFTNRWVDSLPEISRITGSDVIVQTDKHTSFKCTIDRWAKAS
ncbi:hypothetical protein DPMN_180785 [Dreissena polymorpha]|uniref:Galaxin-like repeats domain-containing protein n=2 Tax=Dreissena polymorpha TaxID=45954 RepID=A0A9D4I3P5_DREPO|nr:hypothetical protein DPMN_180785 [Dreissena polymorpha]